MGTGRKLFYSFLILLCFPLYAKVVPKESRHLIVLTELTQHADPKQKWLFSLVESFGEAKTNEILGNSYQQIHWLKNENATLKKLVRALSDVAENKDATAVDLIIHLHGLPKTLSFFDEHHALSDIRDAIKSVKNLAPKLRAVYSTACFGQTHIKEWTLAGFRVASGALGVNANAAYEYPVFLKMWREGETFQKSLEKGNSKTERDFWDKRARMFGASDVNSEKELNGLGESKIDAIDD